MPRPIAHSSGVYHLNIRVPGDLADKVKGTAVTLPLGDAQVTVRPSDKVIVSLRTKDPSVAKARFGPALASLNRQLEAMEAGPRPLVYRQIVALAGQIYRARVRRDEWTRHSARTRFSIARNSKQRSSRS